MIRIYRKCGHGVLQCKAEWEETSPTNLLSAILAAAHAPFLRVPLGPLMIEIDDDLYDLDQLPTGIRASKKLHDRCSRWLSEIERTRLEARRTRPIFGL